MISSSSGKDPTEYFRTSNVISSVDFDWRCWLRLGYDFLDLDIALTKINAGTFHVSTSDFSVKFNGKTEKHFLNLIQEETHSRRIIAVHSKPYFPDRKQVSPNGLDLQQFFFEIVHLLCLMAFRTASLASLANVDFPVSWWLMSLNQLALGPIQPFLLSEREAALKAAGWKSGSKSII